MAFPTEDRFCILQVGGSCYRVRVIKRVMMEMQRILTLFCASSRKRRLEPFCTFCYDHIADHTCNTGRDPNCQYNTDGNICMNSQLSDHRDTIHQPSSA